jgi:hypothetical protein
MVSHVFVECYFFEYILKFINLFILGQRDRFQFEVNKHVLSYGWSFLSLDWNWTLVKKEKYVYFFMSTTSNYFAAPNICPPWIDYPNFNFLLSTTNTCIHAPTSYEHACTYVLSLWVSLKEWDGNLEIGEITVCTSLSIDIVAYLTLLQIP